MRIAVAHNLRTELSEEQAELLVQEDVDRICLALHELRHQVIPVEVSGKPDDVVSRLLSANADLIFNVAEGTIGSSREAFYPGLYEQLGIPFTGGNASLLHMNLDKNLAKTVVSSRGVRVPTGVLLTEKDRQIPAFLKYPLIIKPNSEGSSKGITQESVVEDPDECRRQVNKLMRSFPAGLILEEFIPGRELSVPFLESFPGQILDIVEHTFDLPTIGGRFNIYDYDMKQGGESAKAVRVICPPKLEPEEKKAVLDLARKVFTIMECPDFGRVDIRLHENGTPYFIELNPLPCLHPNASFMTAARACNLSLKDAYRLILRSAAHRYRLALRSTKRVDIHPRIEAKSRPSARELGIQIGRLKPGIKNCITDVKGVKVGHVTNIQDDVKIPGISGKTVVRSGVTAILPSGGDIFHRRLVGGSFILNGIGELSGLAQVMEWGCLESPILLTNSLSVGKIHSGVVSHMMERYPKIGLTTDVVLPVVGETDDSFLNDVRVGLNTSQDAKTAIKNAHSGAVEQGSVGAGTGMITFDFAGGIGTASRVLMPEEGGFHVGVLVLSNFGRMKNLTIDGRVVGRDLDPHFTQPRRENSYGSVIVVIATDAPLISSQLNRVSKRAALGLGRVGSHAASTSGEIIIAFSTANRLPRHTESPGKFLTLRFLADEYVNILYEAVIEATEEAVLNAIFCSQGMTGRENRFSPPIPQEKVVELLRQGREIHACH